jgi:hypothetical protein
MSAGPLQIDPTVLEHAAHLAKERGCTVSEFLSTAIAVMEEAELRQLELRKEIQVRLAESGTSASRPLDMEAFKHEARRRYGES